MDYEKAFKEAYGRASLRFGTNVANELFLEYKESKEERTRRKLIEYFSDWSKTKSYCWGIRVTDIMDWLEKQGKKPAWSEEDEKMYSIIFEEYKNRQYYSHPELKDYDINGQILGWLKSLKQRYTWKPRDEQMKALDSAIDEFDGYREFDSLVSLKKDLEKLKRE